MITPVLPFIVRLTSIISLILFISIATNGQTLLWGKQFSGNVPAGVNGYSIKVDGIGNVYTTGWFASTVDFDPGPGTFNLTSKGEYDIFVSKLDALGNFVWAKQIGGTSTDVARSIAIDVSGNIYMTGDFKNSPDFDPGPGVFTLSSSGSLDIFITKLDALGNFIWAKRMGGIGFDQGTSLTLDNIGNVYITGAFSLTADFDPGSGTFNLTSAGTSDIYVSKLDALGNFIWAKAFGSTSDEEGHNIAVDLSGNVYTTGTFVNTADFNPGTGTFTMASAGITDIFISKLDAAGNFVFAKQIGSINMDFAGSLAVDASENIFITGSFNGSADFDPGTGTFNMTPLGGHDIFISKLDASGNFVFAKQMGGPEMDLVAAISLDAAGNIYTTGHVGNSADFDPGNNTFNLTTPGMFVSKLDPAGNFIWAFSIAGSAQGYSIVTDLSGYIYATGKFESAADFDPGPCVYNLIPAGFYNSYTIKLSSSSSPILFTPTISITQPTCLIPKGIITITSPVGPEYTYSMDGIIYQSSATFSNLTTGSYNISAKNNSGCAPSVSSVVTVSIDKMTSPISVPITSVIQPTCSTLTGTIIILTPTGSGLSYSLNGTSFQASPIFNNIIPGIYNVITKDGNGCTAASPSIIVDSIKVVPASPATSVIQPTCSTPTGTIIISSPTGNNYTINGVTYQTSPIFNNVTQGAYNVTVKDTGGCISAATSVIIDNIPIPSSPIVSVNQPGCSSSTGTINVSSPLGLGYSYSIDDITYQSSGTFNNLVPGTYKIWVKTPGGCSTSSSPVIIDNPLAITLAPVIAITQPDCSLSSGGVTVSSPTGSSYTYSIDGTSYQASPVFNGLNAGTYNVTVRNAGGCTAIAAVTLKQSSGFSLTLTASPDPVLAGKNVVVRSSASVPYQVISWEPVNLFPMQNLKTQIISADTSVTLRIVAKNDFNCFDTSYFDLSVIPLNDLFIPSAFTPNGDGINDLFKIFGSEIKELELKIFNRFGQTVFETREKTKGWNGTFNGTRQENGVYVYFIKVVLKDGTRTTKKGSILLNR